MSVLITGNRIPYPVKAVNEMVMKEYRSRDLISPTYMVRCNIENISQTKLSCIDSIRLHRGLVIDLSIHQLDFFDNSYKQN